MSFLNRIWVLVCLLPLAVFSQFTVVSVKGGLGYQKYFNVYRNPHNVFKLGPVLGLGVEYKIAKRQALKLELFYSQEHQELHYNSIDYFMPGPTEYATISKKHFLTLPLSFQNNFGKKQNWFWSLGGYLSYWTFSRIIYEDAQSRTLYKEDLNQSKRWTSGLVFGMGRKFHLKGRHGIAVETKFNLNIKDNVFVVAPWLLVGYEFGLQRQRD